MSRSESHEFDKEYLKEKTGSTRREKQMQKSISMESGSENLRSQISYKSQALLESFKRERKFKQKITVQVVNKDLNRKTESWILDVEF